MAVVVVVKSVEETYGLTRWALRFAKTLSAEPELKILHANLSREKQTDEIKRTVDSVLADAQAQETAVEFVEIQGNNPEQETLAFVQKNWPELLVVGKQRTAKQGKTQAEFARTIFEKAHCNTLLMRLGKSTGERCREILIPTGGGPHAAKALRLCAPLIGEEGHVSPLLVQSVGQDMEEVGAITLARLVKEANVSSDFRARVNPRVAVGNNISAEIQRVAESGDYDLLLLGAPRVGRLRKALFGTVPDRVLHAEDGMAIGIFRRETPVGERLRAKVGNLLQLGIPQLNREARIAMVEKLQLNSRWNFDFMALIFLATLIAAVGLIQGSTAVVIGAMLVAPLMTPLLGSGLALVQGNWPLMRDCIRAIILGFLTALLVGYVAGVIDPADQLTSELTARCKPMPWDMVVAFFSGIAASYCIARPNLSSALAGVAIAAALVPPIATVGIMLSLAHYDLALGAALLFATNVVAIILGATLCFALAGVRLDAGSSRRKRWVLHGIQGLVIAAVMLLGFFVFPKVQQSAETDVTAGVDLTPFQRIIASDASELVLHDVVFTKGGAECVLEVRGEGNLQLSTLRKLTALVSRNDEAEPVEVRLRKTKEK